MKRNIYLVCHLLVAFLLVGCQNTVLEKYINLEYSDLAVQGEGGTFVIGVECFDTWQYVDDCDWVDTNMLDEKSLSLTVLPNLTQEQRTCVVKVISGDIVQELTITQAVRSFDGGFADLLKLGRIVRVSSNCKFAAGLFLDKVDSQSRMLPVICDFSTGDIMSMDVGKSVYGLSAVSGDGRTVVTSMGKNTEVYRDGRIMELEVPSDYSAAEVMAVSEDGSIMVGNLYQNNIPYPAVWENGKVKEMLPLPKKNALGQLLPSGVRVMGASEDCSVIYGSEPSTFGLIYWKNGEMFDISSQNATVKRVIVISMSGYIETNMACTVNISAYEDFTCISPDGHYIAAKYTDYIQKEQGVPAEIYNYPVLVNTETGEVKIVKTDMEDATGITADNSGLIFGGSPASGYNKGYVFDASNNTYMSLQDWFNQNYGVKIDTDRMVYKVSADRKMFFGMKRCDDFESWYLRID